MATQNLNYGSVTAFTITGTSLANFSAREGTIVTNTANKYIDMVISGKISVGAAAGTGNVFLLASSSDGTNISYPATGTDANITQASFGASGINALGQLQYGQVVPGTGLVFLATIFTAGVPATTVVPFFNIYVAQAFGGNIPIGGIAPVLVNCQGQAFDATPGHTVVNYTGLTYTIA